MSLSAVLCPGICSSGSVGVSRSSRISKEGVNSGNSFHFRNLRCRSDANRMSSSPESLSAPSLLLPEAIDGSGNLAYRFHSLAKNREPFMTKKKKGCGGGELGEVQLPVDIDIINDVDFVGSSNGWVALYDRRKCDLFLSNPIAYRHIKLPPLHTLGAPDRVVLSSDDREGEGEGEDLSLALMTFGSRRRLALCSPRRSNEWTIFGGVDGHPAYDNLVYSSRHRRLFCITEEDEYPKKDNCLLECWDVEHHQSPTLDWVLLHTEEPPRDGFLTMNRWPVRSAFKRECSHLRYLVAAEHSSELFLVVRHVNPRAGPYGSLVRKVTFSRHRGSHYIRTPYKTFDFEVYKVDVERRAVTYMKDSLEGLAMFVGINHPFALPAEGVAGLNPDSVYFTDENRIVEPTRLERTTYGGHDNGIFNYQTKDFYPCCDLYPIEFDKIRKILPLPLWYTPTTII